MPIIVNRLRKFRKKSIKRSLHLIPFFFTFANALLGFLSIIKSADGDFIAAGYCIILAVIMDMLDGRLARAFGCSSSLGMELDSLCDAISFCLAPAILVYNWYFAQLALVGPLVVAAYICAGLFRLARFNCSTHEQIDYFLGMPTPIAALLVVCVVMYEPWISGLPLAGLLEPTGMTLFVVALAYLMISPLRFATFKNSVLSRVHYALIFLFATLLIVHAALYGYPLFFFAILFYVVSGIFATVVHLVRELFPPG